MTDEEANKHTLVVFSSYGNDSVALIQLIHENRDAGNTRVFVLYSNTGWAAPWWPDRVRKGEELAASYGFFPVRTDSVGFVPLVRLKKAWPWNRDQFCTENLKIKPALAWLDEHDPDQEWTCVVGIRREESRRRASFPEWTFDSDKHGGRDLWAPLVRVREEQRNELLARAGFEPLPHRSMECYPCINANKADLRLLDENRIARIEKLEEEMGFTAKGAPRVMFRPHRTARKDGTRGATGIREIVEWAKSKRGEWRPPEDDEDDGPGGACDGGWCGT